MRGSTRSVGSVGRLSRRRYACTGWRPRVRITSGSQPSVFACPFEFSAVSQLQAWPYPMVRWFPTRLNCCPMYAEKADDAALTLPPAPNHGLGQSQSENLSGFTAATIGPVSACEFSICLFRLLSDDDNLNLGYLLGPRARAITVAIVSSSTAASTGLGRYAVAPFSMTRSRASGVCNPVIITTGTWAPVSTN